MKKSNPTESRYFLPGKTYWVQQMSNNGDPLFYEPKNYAFFIRNLKKYINTVAELKAYNLSVTRFELILEFYPIGEINELDIQTLRSINRPYTNFLISYSKAINRHYARQGSLFREHGRRLLLNSEQASVLSERFENELPI